jgi:hypothetical protein
MTVSLTEGKPDMPHPSLFMTVQTIMMMGIIFLMTLMLFCVVIGGPLLWIKRRYDGWQYNRVPAQPSPEIDMPSEAVPETA